MHWMSTFSNKITEETENILSDDLQLRTFWYMTYCTVIPQDPYKFHQKSFTLQNDITNIYDKLWPSGLK